MRVLLRVLGAVAASVLATGGPASATPFSATLSVFAGFLTRSPFLTAAGSGTSTPLLVTLPGSVFAGSASVAPITQTFATAVQLKVTGHGPGTFTGAGLNGAMPFRGHLRVFGSMATVPTLVDVPLSIPVTYGYLGFGVGGSATLPAPGSFDASFHVVHQSWGLGPRSVIVPYIYSFHIPSGMDASKVSMITSYNPGSYTGTDSRTPGGLGQVTLVSPTKVQHIVAGSRGPLGTFVVLGALTLNFVPEPGTLVLLGAGAIGLGLARRARRRS